jgi:glycosyl hydrolase family 16
MWPVQVKATLVKAVLMKAVLMKAVRRSGSVAVAGLAVVVTFAAPASATSSVVENWRGYSGPFHKTRAVNRIVAVSVPGARDGRALKLQLDARPTAGPTHGVEIASNHPAFQYGTFGTRMRTADCTGQPGVGVVTGLLTYATDYSDANLNGMPDNNEIDIEFLCGQTDVVWMSLWTDYDELGDAPLKISRAVNLRTGKVLYNCHIDAWLAPCEPLLAGENQPAAVPAVPGFNAAKQFHTYSFNWQPDRVRFYATDQRGKKITLWDYRGPRSRIPQKPSMFLQNVWHTATWDPLNGPAHKQPTANVAAYLDSTTVPDPAVP